MTSVEDSKVKQLRMCLNLIIRLINTFLREMNHCIFKNGHYFSNNSVVKVAIVKFRRRGADGGGFFFILAINALKNSKIFQGRNFSPLALHSGGVKTLD